MQVFHEVESLRITSDDLRRLVLEESVGTCLCSQLLPEAQAVAFGSLLNDSEKQASNTTSPCSNG